jgi:cell division protein FtsB
VFVGDRDHHQGTAIVNPGEFAAYVFTAVAGLGALGVLTAIARRIAGPYSRRGIGPETVLGVHMASGGAKRELEELRDEVDQLRAEVAELRSRSAELDDVHNRLDFAERMLAQVKERNALPGPR